MRGGVEGRADAEKPAIVGYSFGAPILAALFPFSV